MHRHQQARATSRDRGGRRVRTLCHAALIGAACALPAPAVGAAATVTPPAVSQSPPLSPDAPPMPLGRAPHGVDRSGRTPRGAVPSVRRAPAPSVRTGRLVRGVSDGLLLRRARGAELTTLLRQIRRAGATIVRLPAEWRLAAPRQPAHPGRAGDPAYRFGALDRMVRAAAGAHLEPLLVVSHAPAWAEAGLRWDFAAAGSWGVRPDALGAFAAALARRYSGRYVPRGARAALPPVRLLQAWNEPNLPAYLSPQWAAPLGRWEPWAPRHYRRMLNAFFAAVKRVRRDATVVSGGLAPTGEAIDGEGRMPPVRFLQAFLCLDERGRPVHPRCSDPPRMDALAFHPLSTGDPDLPAISRLDVAVADVSKITGALRTAAAAGLLRGAPPVWVTEMNWATEPRGMPSDSQLPRWIGRALQRLWRAGTRVVIWQFLRDRPGERPAGLRDRRGRPKAALRAFRFPLDVVRESPRLLRVWALAPPGAGRHVCIQRRRRGAWSRLRCGIGSPGRPLTVALAVGGRPRLRAVTRTTRSAGLRVGG